MLFVYTMFDPSKDGRPLMSGVFDDTCKKLSFFTFYASGSGRTYYEIEAIKNRFKALFDGQRDVIINDYKQHVVGFGIKQENHVYDVPIPQPRRKIPYESMRKCLIVILKTMLKIKPKAWHGLRARASLVYAHLQTKGVLFGYTPSYPVWSISTYSGRSKATEFSIQGLSAGDPLANRNNDPIFIQFDWVAADLRAAAIISKDEKLNYAFQCSNPYDFMAEHLNEGVADDDKLQRSEAKGAILSSLYRMDIDGPVMDFYSGVRDWVIQSRNDLHSRGYVKSILGRSFKMGKRFGEIRDERSAFNAIVQGSVASAMQAVIYQVYKEFPDSLLCETHDSLVLTSTSKAQDIKHKIDVVSKIMVRPFAGVLTKNPVFPIVVSVGKKFGKWQKVRRCNT